MLLVNLVHPDLMITTSGEPSFDKTGETQTFGFRLSGKALLEIRKSSLWVRILLKVHRGTQDYLNAEENGQN